MGSGQVNSRLYHRITLQPAPDRLHVLCDFLDANAISFERVLSEPDLVVLYAKTDEELASRKHLLASAGFNDYEVDLFEYDPDEWVEKWKDYFDWTRISPRLSVGPVFKPCPFDTEHKILIDPGQSFGTGSHESTRIALFLLDVYLLAGQTVCDAGCGSGVLSFVAEKYSGRPAVAFDFDRESCFDCLRNAALNDANPMVFRGGTAPVNASFDLVVANILAHILVTVSPDIRSMVKPGGLLLLSGLTDADAATFEDEFFTTPGEFNRLERLAVGDWWGGTWKKAAPTNGPSGA